MRIRKGPAGGSVAGDRGREMRGRGFRWVVFGTTRRREDIRPCATSMSWSRLYAEDQSDRMPGNGKPIDWSIVGPRDRKREARVKELYEAGSLRTGKDFFRAAMVLQHASRPEDYLLAHEFCLAALAKGDQDARWLGRDRGPLPHEFGRPQRFGTQYRSSGPDQPVRLYEVGPGVTDALRRELNVPSLAEARKREAHDGGDGQGQEAGSRREEALSRISLGGLALTQHP